MKAILSLMFCSFLFSLPALTSAAEVDGSVEFVDNGTSVAVTIKGEAAEKMFKKFKDWNIPLHALCEGVATEEDLKKIDKEAQKEAEDSAEFAKSSPYPEPETIFEDVYWEVDNKTEAGQTGRHFFND